MIQNRIITNEKAYTSHALSNKPILDNSSYVFADDGTPIDLKTADARKANKLTRLQQFIHDYEVPDFHCHVKPTEVIHLTPEEFPIRYLSRDGEKRESRTEKFIKNA